MTNGDLIRKMSNEELAIKLPFCPDETGMAKIDCDSLSYDKNCCRCLYDWLNQEAEEE